jgi:hypothetical protein
LCGFNWAFTTPRHGIFTILPSSVRVLHEQRVIEQELPMSKRIQRRPTRFDNLSDEEIQARWRALRPMSIKWLIICALATPSVFLLYHFWQPGPQWAYIFSLAYRITVGGTGMFAFLACLAFYFSRSHRSA